jgi:hypothetical protein
MKKGILLAGLIGLLTSGASVAATPTGVSNALPTATATTMCGTVWTGKVARLRVYDQTGNQRVFVYVYPGSNDSYVGYSENPNMIEALFKNRDNDTGAALMGYSGTDCHIQWIDY